MEHLHREENLQKVTCTEVDEYQNIEKTKVETSSRLIPLIYIDVQETNEHLRFFNPQLEDNINAD